MARELGMTVSRYMSEVTPREHRANLLYLRRPSNTHRLLAEIAYQTIRPNLKNPERTSSEDFLYFFDTTHLKRLSEQPDASCSFSQERDRDDSFSEEEHRSRAAYQSKKRWGMILGRKPDGTPNK